MKIRCPICRRITTWEENTERPFCSERCRITDLGSWASEEYRIPLENESDETKHAEDSGSRSD